MEIMKKRGTVLMAEEERRGDTECTTRKDEEKCKKRES
jgi:hypothetical protein